MSGERIQTFSAHSLDKYVNASAPRTIHERSYPSTVTKNKDKLK